MDFKSDRGELAPFNEEIPVTGTISILKQLNGPPLPNRIHLDLRLKKRLDWGGDLFTQYKLSARRAVYDFYGSVDPNDTSKEPSVMALLDKYWVEHMTRDEVSQQLIDAEMIKCVSESDLLADAQRNIDKPYFVYCLLYESFEKGDIKEPSTVSKLLFMFSSAPEMNSQIKALALCKGNAAIQASILHKIDIELLDSKMPDDAFITSRAILLCAMDSAMNSEADTKTLFSEVNNRSIALMHAKGW
jgi:hypothetical protein